MENIEFEGPQKLITEETKKTYKDKLKAKEIFESEIVGGRIYFDFKNNKYYLRKRTSKDNNDMITFREEKKLEYLLAGLSTQSEVERFIRTMYEKFPPIVYKVKHFQHGTKEVKKVEYLTEKEEEIFDECYKNKIYEIDEIKNKLELPKSCDLQITPCASAVDLLQNTVEMRATADATAWDVVKRVCYSCGDKKDEPLFQNYEDFLNYEDSIDLEKKLSEVIDLEDKNIKKK